MPTKLTQTLSLLYRMQNADVRQLENDLLESRKRAWDAALREEAARHGCTRTPSAPRRGDLAELRRQSRADAQSIAQTWNRDITREIERLYDSNPRGNRQFYFSNLERYAAERAQWKNAQIALNTETTAAEYAREQFRRLNHTGSERYRLVGAPPVCAVCARLYGLGHVAAAVVERNPMPAHLNCAHSWSVINPPRIPCEALWLG